MFNIKNIVNKITDRGRDSNPNSPGRAGNEDDIKEDSKLRAEGFLCPKCMKAFTTPEELKSHYELSHDDNSMAADLQGASGFFSLHQEVGERYKQYQDGNLNNEISRLTSGMKIEEVASITDISVLQKCLSDTLESKAILQIEKEHVEQRAAQLAKINVTLKAASDEGESSQTALKERLKVVEAQLAHRESIDDAAVLRQELVQVQRVMDELNRERERERDALRTELQLLQDKYYTLEEKSSSTENENAMDVRVMLEKKENEFNQLAAELELSKQQSAQMVIKHTQEVSYASQMHAEQIERLKNERVSVYEELMALVKSLRNELSLSCNEIDVSRHNFNSLQTKAESFSLQINDGYQKIKFLQDEMELCIQQKDTLKMELLQKCQECNDLKREKSDYGNKVDDLNNALTMSLEKMSKLESEHSELVEQIQAGEGANTALQQLTQENSSLQRKLKEQIGRHDKYVEEMSIQINDLKEKLKEADVQCHQRQLYFENCQSRLININAELDKANKNLNMLQDQITVKDEELADMHNSCKVLQADLETVRTQYDEMERSLHHNEVQYKDLLELYQDSKSVKDSAVQETIKLKDTIEDLSRDLGSKNSEILDMNHEIETFQSKEHDFQENITNFKLLMDKKENQLVKLIEENKEIIEEKLSLDEKVKTLEEQLQVLGVQRASLETTLFELQKNVAELESDKKDFEEERKKESDKLQGTIVNKSQALQYLENRSKLLMQERGKITKQIEQLEQRLAEEIDQSRQKYEDLHTKFSSCQLEKEELEKTMAAEREKIISLEGDIENLNESLNSTIKENYEKIQTLQASLDETSGEKLALEAQLEASQAEQQTLLERCYSCASETENLRRTISDLRRKLDESQAALHELGRENQTLQLDLEKLEGRKWTEDSDVTKCTQCQKDFNVIVRKHHCRNCGKIFCNECSNKSALVASYKKAVRVCEPCYNELTPK